MRNICWFFKFSNQLSGTKAINQMIEMPAPFARLYLYMQTQLLCVSDEKDVYKKS